MVKHGGCVAAVLSLLAFGLSGAHAQEVISGPQTQVQLVAGKAVYMIGCHSGVHFTLTNETSHTLTMSTPNPWSIRKDHQLVYVPVSPAGLAQISPGKSRTWAWDMKGLNGKLVPKGSYTIEVGQLWLGGAQFTRSVTVALTPSGTIAGTNSFPLAVGNEWNYSASSSIGSPLSSMRVVQKWPNSNWFKVTNLIGMDRWATHQGAAKPTLFVIPHPLAKTIIQPLFRFRQKVGFKYTTSLESFTYLMVGAKNETVVTPVGTFTGCYRIDVVISTIADGGYMAFWFAPGVGLVQYKRLWIGGPKLYKLESAKIQGSDNQQYGIGR